MTNIIKAMRDKKEEVWISGMEKIDNKFKELKITNGSVIISPADKNTIPNRPYLCFKSPKSLRLSS